MPHVWTPGRAACWSRADEVIVVAQPDLANLRNAKNIIDNIKTARPHDHPPRLILNNVGVPKRPEIPVADFTKTIEIEPTCVIPHDAKLFGSAANNGQMIAEVEPKGKNAETFGNLANLIAGRGEVKKMKRGSVRSVLLQVVEEGVTVSTVA